MSHVAVLPTSRLTSDEWAPQIQTGLRALKVHGLEEVRILADDAPVAESWVSNPKRQNSGVIWKSVSTLWPNKRDRNGNVISPFSHPGPAAMQRNIELLQGVEHILVLGHVYTNNEKMVLERVFGSPRNTVVQVIDGVATPVGRETIVCDDEKYRPRTKAVAEPSTEADAWGEFTGPAPKSRTKKS